MQRIRVLIADGELSFREHLCKLLGLQRRIEVIGEADDVDCAFALADLHSPDILLLDYAICGRLAVRGAADQARWRERPLIVVTLSTPDRKNIIESFRFGAKGIILKGSPARAWWRGMAAVVGGQYWLGNESLAVLIQAIRESPSRSRTTTSLQRFGLTPREIEIVQKIADGRTNKEVGEHYSIRERTVKHHLTNIFGKVGVSSRLELALFARDHQIASLNERSQSIYALGHHDIRQSTDEYQIDSTPHRSSLKTSEQPEK